MCGKRMTKIESDEEKRIYRERLQKQIADEQPSFSREVVLEKSYEKFCKSIDIISELCHKNG